MEKLEEAMKGNVDVMLLQETRMTRNNQRRVTRRMEENGYRIVMKKNNDDAMILIRNSLEEVHIPEEERLRAGLDQQFRKYLNEVRIRGTLGPVRVISVYVPSTMKEKKEFLEQLKRVLETLEEEFIIGGDFNCVEDNEKDAEPKKTTGLTTTVRVMSENPNIDILQPTQRPMETLTDDWTGSILHHC
ncbi:unnamed protein product [Ambrosiozyma monospora]|uniref:Unnamed protein product n=1 Tax=Ambrosiozyma monospora TaxID=43982 RepID=A0A9W7DJE6_AMBMO|nr:unnamed protein product [Ambrosiozyma monospora]